MKNIILQHYDGKLGELEKLSTDNISNYAKKCGAEYELVLGRPMGNKLSVQSQKLCVLSDKYDDYDMVVMLDIDMFERKGQTENVFTDVEGIGMYADIQKSLHRSLVRSFPFLGSMSHPYWGGAIYRLNKEERKKLRENIDVNELSKFNSAYYDEGCMHRLAYLSGLKFSTLPGEYKWCHCSYREGIENAALIHIRTKITPTGPKRKKIENYNELVKRGMI